MFARGRQCVRRGLRLYAAVDWSAAAKGVGGSIYCGGDAVADHVGLPLVERAQDAGQGVEQKTLEGRGHEWRLLQARCVESEEWQSAEQISAEATGWLEFAQVNFEK